MKKLIYLALTIILISSTFFGATAIAETTATKKNALFLKSTSISLDEGNTICTIKLNFSEDLMISGTTPQFSTYGDKISINDKTLTTIFAANATATSTFPQSGGFYKTLQLTFPTAVVKLNGTDKIFLQKSFGGTTFFETTVDYMYSYSDKGVGQRIYRFSDDQFDDVELLSIGAPAKTKGVRENMIIKLYFSKEISSRKIINTEIYSASHFIALALKEFPYRDLEVLNYFNFGIFGESNHESLIYKMQFGSTKHNGLKVFGTESEMKSQGQVNGLDLYDLKTLMESTGGSNIGLKMLSLQVHMSGSSIEFGLKGDASAADVANEIQNNYEGYNLAPDTAAENDMVIRLKKGMLFPSGVMIKEDITFYWDRNVGYWAIHGGDADEPLPDSTLGNQGGYTDDEIVAMRG